MVTGKEIRRWAWKKAKERRGLLIAICLAEILPLYVINRLLLAISWPLREAVSFPFHVLGGLFQLGALFVILKAIQEEEIAFCQIMVPFHREWLKKAAIVTVVYLLAVFVVQLIPNLLMENGKKLMELSGYQGTKFIEGNVYTEEYNGYRHGNSLRQFGNSLGSLLSLVLGGIWLPVNYLLFLKPEKTAFQVIREGTSLGLRSLGKIIVFQIVTILPVMILPLLLGVVLTVKGTGAAAVIAAALFIGVLAWMTPYVEFALAGLVLELSGNMKLEKKKKKRK